VPQYSFICSHCRHEFVKFVSIGQYKDHCKCRLCGKRAEHSYAADHAGGTADSQHRAYSFEGETGTRMYGASYLPNQAAEAKKNHKGREFREHNGCLLPVIKDRTDKLKYLSEYGGGYVELS